MPHVPRGFAPTFGDPPDDRRGKTDTDDGKTDDKPARQRFGVARLSVRSWSPDFDQMAQTLLGGGIEADEHTGQLVPTRPA